MTLTADSFYWDDYLQKVPSVGPTPETTQQTGLSNHWNAYTRKFKQRSRISSVDDGNWFEPVIQIGCVDVLWVDIWIYWAYTMDVSGAHVARGPCGQKDFRRAVTLRRAFWGMWLCEKMENLLMYTEQRQTIKGTRIPPMDPELDELLLRLTHNFKAPDYHNIQRYNKPARRDYWDDREPEGPDEEEHAPNARGRGCYA
jgi:hypothetical protein